MRQTFAAVLLLLIAATAAADGVSGSALLSFQRYDLGLFESAGLRQTYDLHLDRTLTATSLVRLLFRGDDFRGSQSTPRGRDRLSNTRQFQPIGELVLNTGTFSLQARTDFLDLRSRLDSSESSRRVSRSSGRLNWSPTGLPSLTVLVQRAETTDSGTDVSLTDENASAHIDHAWHGLSTSAEGLYSRSVDPRVGFERKSTTAGLQAAYAFAAAGNRVTGVVDANVRTSDIRERAIGEGGTSIPVPVTVMRILHGVDETPGDDRDQTLTAVPALRDGDLNTSAGIALGPESASFHNIALEIGRVEQADEIRVIVRDAAGNPLRNGGGPVTWDLYTSEDGHLWTPVTSAATAYRSALSYYEVTFPLMTTRWLKVVNFGVNVEPAFVTEVQLYYHRRLDPHANRNGSQQTYNASATATYRPTERLELSYVGMLTGLEQEIGAIAYDTSSVDVVATVQYSIAKALTARVELQDRKSAGTFVTESLRGYRGSVDYSPTPRLRLGADVSRQQQALIEGDSTIDSLVLRGTGQVYRSWNFTFDAGRQLQTMRNEDSPAQRLFVNLTSGAQLLRSLRMQVSGTMQQVTADVTDTSTLLLGAARDNRLATELIWRAGRPLLLSTRIGWTSGAVRSGLTQRYRLEWYPFADGTVSLGGTYDEDIDPLTNRNASRLVVNPRWNVNSWATFDLNYTAVSSGSSSLANDQKTFFATLTLTR